MRKTRIAIACQGGGSQCAFVAGALKSLFTHRIQDRFEIVGLSGTSGGALTAAVAWAALIEQGRDRSVSVQDRILALWRDLTAQTPLEIALDQYLTQSLRLVARGVVPQLATSPSALPFRLMTEAFSRMVSRPEFTDLRALLNKHLDFEAFPSLLHEDSPALLIGACDIL
ncbi:MAG TPA: patatin-like phospholipase family protein, partial [Polyangiaceae bacterium]